MRVRWQANGHRRHAFRSSLSLESACGAVRCPVRYCHPLPLCLACLHALCQEQQRPPDRAREWREDEAA